MPAPVTFYGQRRHALSAMLISVLALGAFWLELRWAASELGETEQIPPVLTLFLFLPTFALYLVSLIWLAFPRLSWIRLNEKAISWRAFPGRKRVVSWNSIDEVSLDADDTLWLQGAVKPVALPYNAGLPGAVLLSVIERHRLTADTSVETVPPAAAA